ncbi:hypothetical protein BP5796_10246 [Coleophoma crateriformis]|uniref:Xylanolytic transcriptional activator regulatory domain-containing protein n=1 Tax=Coleophoma crateriformis TaxID=565419 RepID=A0A3D8QVL4_9HELO|nr:hypothetical protein BP5796_10246 [Coleophoma crateriformis]
MVVKRNQEMREHVKHVGQARVVVYSKKNNQSAKIRAKARPRRVRAGARCPNADITDKQRSAAQVTEFTFNLPSVTGPDSKNDVASLRSHHDVVFSTDATLEANYDTQSYFKKSPDSTAEMQQSIPSAPQIIQQRRISFKEASRLLLVFRTRMHFSPFVVIPPDATISSLSRTSPFLLLAILTTCATSDPDLHHQLDHEFRRVLSLKVIVNGEKSLDYLQGLLVYVSWYPFHIRPKNNQAFMFLNLATSLVVDLGLDREYPNPNISISDIRLDGLIDGYVFTKAAKRAYLGCYYLYSSLSLGFHKTNNFKYTDLMTTHAEALMRDEVPSDTSLYAMLRLQRLTERVGETSSATKPPVFDPITVSLSFEMNVQIFQNELQEWKATTPPPTQLLPFVGLAERFLNICIYSHELGSLRKPYHHANQILETSNDSDSPTHLAKCLMAGKRYFEFLLSIPETNYWDLTTVLWGNIVQTILILSRLTFLLAALNDWDADTTRENIPLGMYLECLCYRMQSLSRMAKLMVSQAAPAGDSKGTSTTATTATTPDVMFVFYLVMQSVKTSYERRVSNIKPNFFFVENGVAVGGARGHCPMMDPNLNPYFEPREETAWHSNGGEAEWDAEGKQVEIPALGNLWSTMTSSWAEEF